MSNAEDINIVNILIGNIVLIGQLFAAFVTALATIALWRVTKVLAVETKTLAKMTSQPFVVCWLESSLASSTAIDLKLINTGNAAAFDVKMELTPGLPDKIGLDAPGPDPDSKFEFDTSLLPPSKEQRIRGAMSTQIHETKFNVTLSWSRYPGSKDRDNITYSFTARDGFHGGFTAKGIHHVAQELEAIKKKIK